MNSVLHCVDITDQSVESLGVVCRTHQEVIVSVINRTIEQTLQTCLEQTTTSVSNQPTTNSQPATTSGPNQPTNSQPITTGGTNQPTTNSKLTMTSGTDHSTTTTSEVDQSISANEMVGSCPIASLGGVTGLLVVVLVGLAIVLTVTCCVLGKRRSQKQQAE